MRLVHNEAFDKSDIYAIWNGLNDPGSYYSDAFYDLGVSQYAEIGAGTIDSYSSSAFIKSNKAEGSQTADVIDVDTAEFYGSSSKGVPYYENWVSAETGAEARRAEEVAYSSKSKSSSSEMTSSQTLNVQSAVYADKWADAASSIGDYDYLATSESIIGDYYHPYYSIAAGVEETLDEYDAPLGSMKGSDTAKAKKNYVSTTSDVDASAVFMGKGASADGWDNGVYYSAISYSNVDAYITEDKGLSEIQTTMSGSDSTTAKKGYAYVTSDLDVDDAGSVSSSSSADNWHEGNECLAESLSNVESYISEEGDALFLASVKNSDVATAKKDYASVTSDLDASNADYVDRLSLADSWNEDSDSEYHAYSWSYMGGLISEEYDVEIPASMKGIESVTAKKNYASATQKLDAKGATIVREIEAWDGYYEDRGVYAETYLFDVIWDYDYGWIDQYPASASSLKGSSTATVTAKDSSLKGSWSVNLAEDITVYPNDGYWASFSRWSEAWNEKDWAYAGAQKTSIDQDSTFSFKESAKENSKGTTAA